jgi:hypothetical protein
MTKKRLGSDEGSRVIYAHVTRKKLFVFVMTLEIPTASHVQMALHN